MKGYELLLTGGKRLLSLTPLILIILIFEGTLRTYAWVAMLLWMGYYTYKGVSILKKNGSIDLLSAQLRGKK